MTEINELIDKMERAVIDYETKPTEKGRQLAERAEQAIREYVAPLEKRVAELEGAVDDIRALARRKLPMLDTDVKWLQSKFDRIIEKCDKLLEAK